MNTKTRIDSSQSQHQLMENILEIIDSKIQYIKFNLEKTIRSSAPTREHSSHLSPPQRAYNEASSNQLLASTDILDKIEVASKIINRLLLLRNNLNPYNAKLIFELLSNNTYLDYSSEDLKKVVDKK